MWAPVVLVARDTVDGTDVSTVFTIYGDHSVSPPLVYVTRASDGREHKSATEIEAIAAHTAMVASLHG